VKALNQGILNGGSTVSQVKSENSFKGKAESAQKEAVWPPWLSMGRGKDKYSCSTKNVMECTTILHLVIYS
jgi:hypothetical protein